MKLLESYASVCGVDLKKSSPPDIYEVFYPAPAKYITIQNSSGFESKNYDLWQDVIDLVWEELLVRDIQILQLGDEKSKPLNKAIRLAGKTTIHQSNYLIKRAILHMGNDSCLNYMCAANNTPLISVYGSTRVSNHSPYHLPEKVFLFESHRRGKEPSFSPVENPKTINYIPPEKIANAILEVIGSSKRIVERTVYAGPIYGGVHYEYIPNHKIYDGLNLEFPLIIRADLADNNDFINLALMKYKSVVVLKSNNPNVRIDTRLMANIHAVSCEVDENTPLSYIASMKKVGWPVVFLSKDAKNISKIRANLFSETVVKLSNQYNKKDFLEDIGEYTNGESVDFEKLRFKTNKFVLSRDEAFPSIQHALRGIRLQEHNEILDIPEFYEECEKFLFKCLS